jgi:hypothetical protein
MAQPQFEEEFQDFDHKYWVARLGDCWPFGLLLILRKKMKNTCICSPGNWGTFFAEKRSIIHFTTGVTF